MARSPYIIWFSKEHKFGTKIGPSDFLSRHPSSDAKPVSTYDSMFTVAKIGLIPGALGFKKLSFSKAKLESLQAIKRRLCIISNGKQSLEVGITCEGNWTNHRVTNCISGRSSKFNANSVGAAFELSIGYTKSYTSFKISNLNIEQKLRKLLERHPSISNGEIVQNIQQLPQRSGALEVIPLKQSIGLSRWKLLASYSWKL